MTQRPTKVDELQKLAAMDPGDPTVFFMLGNELVRAGRPEEGAEALRQCLQLNPEYTAAQRLLADAWRMANRPDKAIREYEKAIALAEKTGDLQVAKEARARLKKLKAQ